MSQENGEAAATGPAECSTSDRPNSNCMSSAPDDDSIDPTNLYIENLPRPFTDKQLLECFKKAGFEPVSTRVLPGTKYNDRSAGFCRMNSRDDCKRAISALEGKFFDSPGNSRPA